MPAHSRARTPTARAWSTSARASPVAAPGRDRGRAARGRRRPRHPPRPAWAAERAHGGRPSRAAHARRAARRCIGVGAPSVEAAAARSSSAACASRARRWLRARDASPWRRPTLVRALVGLAPARRRPTRTARARRARPHDPPRPARARRPRRRAARPRARRPPGDRRRDVVSRVALGVGRAQRARRSQRLAAGAGRRPSRSRAADSRLRLAGPRAGAPARLRPSARRPQAGAARAASAGSRARLAPGPCDSWRRLHRCSECRRIELQCSEARSRPEVRPWRKRPPRHSEQARDTAADAAAAPANPGPRGGDRSRPAVPHGRDDRPRRVMGAIIAVPASRLRARPGLRDGRRTHSVDLGPATNFQADRQGEIPWTPVTLREPAGRHRPACTGASPSSATRATSSPRSRTPACTSAAPCVALGTGFGCPCHGGQYDTRGPAHRRPAGAPAQPLRVRRSTTRPPVSSGASSRLRTGRRGRRHGHLEAARASRPTACSRYLYPPPPQARSPP